METSKTELLLENSYDHKFIFERQIVGTIFKIRRGFQLCGGSFNLSQYLNRQLLFFLVIFVMLFVIL